jgi:hypothetical protein
MNNLTTILQYSTIDIRFLEINLAQASKFSDEIIIPICDHFFNGEKENKELLAESYQIASKFDKCSIYMFEWDGVKSNTGYYHNLSRALGTNIAKNEWLLFLDADEIVDDEFEEWFETVKHTDLMYWLTCYWYFREPIYQSKTKESAGLLIRKNQCNWNINVREERQQLFNHKLVNGDLQPILSSSGLPLVHHYSWVRSKTQMIDKVKNWGHRNDKDWVALIEKEFNKEFDGTDFIHGYQYNTVDNKFNL